MTPLVMVLPSTLLDSLRRVSAWSTCSQHDHSRLVKSHCVHTVMLMTIHTFGIKSRQHRQSQSCGTCSQPLPQLAKVRKGSVAWGLAAGEVHEIPS